jgi:hypothetical protein
MAPDFSYGIPARVPATLRWVRPGILLLLAVVSVGAPGCRARGPAEADRDTAALPVQGPSMPQVEISATDGGRGELFGQSVAMSGGTAVVGASRHANGTGMGVAYVFERSGAAWTQETVLTGSDSTADDYFGLSVAVSGETAIVGANEHQVGANRAQGAAYVFVRSGATWTQQTMLTANDGAAGDCFGYSVAVSGDTAVIGATGPHAMRGAAYVFERSGTTWTQKPVLTARDGAAGDYFGFSVAVNGGTALVGANRHKVGDNPAQGAAYVFEQSGPTWIERETLTASDGKEFGLFGSSMALSGGTAVIGAFNQRVGSTDGQGEAYVFVSNGTTWARQAPLMASDGRSSDSFGQSVATNGSTIVVGAFNRMVGENRGQGAAYVFAPAGASWVLQAMVTAADGHGDAPLGVGLDAGWPVGDNLGWSAAMSGDTFLLGARFHTSHTSHAPGAGAAYLFTLPAAAKAGSPVPGGVPSR